ncbi:MAG: NERD domain-containing protein [Planctomycetes bacterium]|nr:NERD domain-containing protein [Planctomycetota bacterium]
MATIRKAGPFANEAERRAVAALERALPPNAVIVTNFYLPSHRDTLEIDAVVVSALGVVAVEVKDWRGEIHFESAACYRGAERVEDPRQLVSHKAKVLHSFLRERVGSRGPDVVTNPILLFARDDTRIDGDLGEGVRVARLSEGVGFVARGFPGGRRQSPALNADEIARTADAMCAAHDRRHHRRIGAYALGEKLADPPAEEYRGWELAFPERGLRLARRIVDDLAPPAEREEDVRSAKRHAVALRELEELRLAALPIVYSVFADPNDDAGLWTAYEGVEGAALSDAPLQPMEKVAALARAAEALEACHRKSVLHRGLSPECLVIPAGGSTPRIIRFEFARVRGQKTVAAGRSAGRLKALPNAAPEVRKDPMNASPASDIYSLGTVAAEVLAGERLLEPARVRDLVKKIRPRDVAEVVRKMVEDDPRRRFASMALVAQALWSVHR